MGAAVNANAVIGLVHRSDSGQRDEFGNDVPGESFDTTLGVYAPGGSTEAVFGQDQVVTSPTVYLPSTANVTASDAVIPQVLVDRRGNIVPDANGNPQGDRYEIDGAPESWPTNPFTGWQPDFPIVVRLKRTTG